MVYFVQPILIPVAMGNQYETEKGEVFIYNGNAQQEESGCACGGNCACKSGGKQECGCGGSCSCK